VIGGTVATFVLIAAGALFVTVDRTRTPIVDPPPTIVDPPPSTPPSVVRSPTTVKRPPPSADIFSATRNGHSDIFRLDLNTQIENRLTNSGDNVDNDSLYSGFAPIVFASNRDGGPYQIYVMNWDGSGQRRLTSTADDDRQPRWSPRQTHIVFVSMRDGRRQLYIMKADGSDQHRLLDSPKSDFDPAWASNVRFPSGKDDMDTDIAFASNRDNDIEIYAVRPDGSALRRLTDSPGNDRSPQWSPDGTRIVFVSERDGNSEIYVMSADGSGQARLTDNPANDNGPLWSANGDRINFASDRTGTRQSFSMRADGTDQTKSPNQTS
jgi:Tol biopolymer transport system component